MSSFWHDGDCPQDGVSVGVLGDVVDLSFCALVSCICESKEEEEWTGSHSIRSRLVI